MGYPPETYDPESEIGKFAEEVLSVYMDWYETLFLSRISKRQPPSRNFHSMPDFVEHLLYFYSSQDVAHSFKILFALGWLQIVGGEIYPSDAMAYHYREFYDFEVDEILEAYINPGRTTISKRVRKSVFEKTGGRCYLCNNKISLRSFHVEHEKPLSAGGRNSYSNLFPACPPCNLSKGSRFGEMLHAQINGVDK